MPPGPQPRRYTVQILLPRRVRLEPQHLLRQLQVWREGVEILPGAHPLAFAIPTDDLPLLVAVFAAAPDAYAAPLCEAMTWTPSWHQRWDEMGQRYRASLVIAMTAQRPINYATALLAFLAVLDTVLFSIHERVRDEAVLHWMPAQQLLTLARYLELRTELGPSGPAVNVRVVNATGRPGELLADTIGLAELGLPDLQVAFTDRDPADVARHLRHLVRGMFVGDRLDCGWIEEASRVPPARDALTLQLD